MHMLRTPREVYQRGATRFKHGRGRPGITARAWYHLHLVGSENRSDPLSVHCGVTEDKALDLGTIEQREVHTRTSNTLQLFVLST